MLQGNKTGKKRKSFGKRENLLIEEAFHHYQTDKNSETAKVTEENGHVFWIKFSDNMMYSQQLPSEGFKVFRKEIIKGIFIVLNSFLPTYMNSVASTLL